MEMTAVCITALTAIYSLTKNRLMTPPKWSLKGFLGIPGTRTFLNRLIILGFMALVGYCLAYSIQSKSVMGFILALAALSAGIYFLHLLAKAKEESEKEETV
jgi:hypothetical protein